MRRTKTHMNAGLMSLIGAAIMLSFSSGCAEFGEVDEESESLDHFDEDVFKAGSQNGIEVRSIPFINGLGGYHTYRTPSLVKAKNGDILAFAGARDAHGDNSRGNVVLRRSSDAGQTWGPIQTVAGKRRMKNRNGLPSAVTLPNGKIILLYMWSKYATSDDDRGCRKMYQRTSTDHGATWSERIDITDQTQKPCEENELGQVASHIEDGNWGWTGLGPVHGIVKRKEPHRGRILFAARHKASNQKSYAHVIYSDDEGESWNIGGSLDIKSSEATVVELPNGEIMLNARSTGSSTHRIVGVSDDGGQSFYTTEEDETLIEPGCQGSLLRYGKDILFSNPVDTEKKRNGTLRRSVDGGITWPYEVMYQAPHHFSGYSDLIRKNGDIGILVEWGPSFKTRKPHTQIRYIVVPKETLGL